MKSIRVNKKWIKDYEKAQVQIEDLEVLFEFYKEGEANTIEVEHLYQKTVQHIEDLEFKNMLSRSNLVSYA